MSVVPTAYTEEELARYMARTLGVSVVASLDWTAEADITGGNLAEYQEPVADTLLLLDQTDISQYTTPEDIRGVRVVARWQVWRAARESVSDRYDEAIGGGVNWKRSQLYNHLLKNEMREQAAAIAIGGDQLASSSTVVQIVPPAVPQIDEPEFG